MTITRYDVPRGTTVAEHETGDWVRFADVEPLLRTLDEDNATLRAALRAEQQGQEPVAYLVRVEGEPDLGHWFAEEPDPIHVCQPLYTRPAPASQPVGEAVALRELLGHISDVLPDEAFDKIDTAKWNAVSATVGEAVADQMADRQWRSGFLAGWNAGVEGDEAKLRAAQNRAGALDEYQAAPSVAQEGNHG